MEIDFIEVLARPLVLPTGRHGLRVVLEAAAEAVGRSLNVYAEVNSATAILALLSGGLAFSILPRSLVEHPANQTGSCYSKAKISNLGRRVALVWPGIQRNPATSEVSKIIVTIASHIRG